MGKLLACVLEEQKNVLETKTLNSFFDIKFISAKGKQIEETIWEQIVSFVKFAKRQRANRLVLSRHLEDLKSIANRDLHKVMTDALDFNTKILISNTSSKDVTLIPVSNNLFWADSITDFQFLVIYEACFDLILNEDFSIYSTISECLENITSNKMLIYPMVNARSEVKIDHEKIHKRMERLIHMNTYLQKNKYKLRQIMNN